MPIRFAQLDDIPTLVEGGRRMHALTRFRCFSYGAERVARGFADLIQRGQGKYVVLVAEINFGINSEDAESPVGRFARKMGYVKVGENYVRACV